MVRAATMRHSRKSSIDDPPASSVAVSLPTPATTTPTTNTTTTTRATTPELSSSSSSSSSLGVSSAPWISSSPSASAPSPSPSLASNPSDSAAAVAAAVGAEPSVRARLGVRFGVGDRERLERAVGSRRAKRSLALLQRQQEQEELHRQVLLQQQQQAQQKQKQLMVMSEQGVTPIDGFSAHHSGSTVTGANIISISNSSSGSSGGGGSSSTGNSASAIASTATTSTGTGSTVTTHSDSAGVSGTGAVAEVEKKPPPTKRPPPTPNRASGIFGEGVVSHAIASSGDGSDPQLENVMGGEMTRLEEFVSGPLSECVSKLASTLLDFDDDKEAQFKACKEDIENTAKRIFADFFIPELKQLKDKAAAEARAKRRNAIVAELAATEADYLNDLHIMSNIWIPQLTATNCATQQELNLLFGTIPQFIMLSTELADEFKKAKTAPIKDQKIGGSFKNLIPFIRIYTEFALARDQASELLATLRQNRKFTSTVEKLRHLPEVRNLDLPDYLIKPAQRIVKYPLLLSDLIKHTDPTHIDYKDLVEAESTMRKVLNEINSSTRNRQTLLVLSKLIPNLTWKQEPIDLLGMKTHLLLGENIKIIFSRTEDEEQQKGNYIYIFDTLILGCHHRSGKWTELTWFHITDCILKENVPNSKSELALCVAHRSRPEEIIVFPTDPQQRQLIISLISDAIRDAPIESKPILIKYTDEEKKTNLPSYTPTSTSQPSRHTSLPVALILPSKTTCPSPAKLKSNVPADAGSPSPYTPAASVPSIPSCTPGSPRSPASRLREYPPPAENTPTTPGFRNSTAALHRHTRKPSHRTRRTSRTIREPGAAATVITQIPAPAIPPSHSTFISTGRRQHTPGSTTKTPTKASIILRPSTAAAGTTGTSILLCNNNNSYH
ncbi:RHO1 GDP-GTP exchange protein 1/2 [Pelomyxa schiedti]|nr:RHO1 GDP-GTP exchange protein 1/2 [Pelomyxa schiedti]